MRCWKVTVKRTGSPAPVVAEVSGDYELEDIRQGLGLEHNDVEWYAIQPKK